MNIVNLSEKQFVELILESFNNNNISDTNENAFNNQNSASSCKNIFFKKEQILNINLDNLKNKHYQLIQMKAPKNDCKFNRCLVKTDLQVIRGKVILRFYVDVILVNQLDEDVNLFVNRNTKRIKKHLDADDQKTLVLKETEKLVLESLKGYHKAINSLNASCYIANANGASTGDEAVNKNLIQEKIDDKGKLGSKVQLNPESLETKENINDKVKLANQPSTEYEQLAGLANTHNVRRESQSKQGNPDFSEPENTANYYSEKDESRKSVLNLNNQASEGRLNTNQALFVENEVFKNNANNKNLIVPNHINNKSSPYTNSANPTLNKFNYNNNVFKNNNNYINYNTNTNSNYDLNTKTLFSKQAAKVRIPRKTSIDTDVISITNKTHSTFDNFNDPDALDNLAYGECFELNQKNSTCSLNMLDKDFLKLSGGLLKFLDLDKVLNDEDIASKIEKSALEHHQANVLLNNLNENLSSSKAYLNLNNIFTANNNTNDLNSHKNNNNLIISKSNNDNNVNLNNDNCISPASGKAPDLREIYLAHLIKTRNSIKILPFIKTNKINKKIYRERILEESCFLSQRSNWVIASEFLCLFEDDRFFIETEDSEKEELLLFNPSNDQIYQDYSLTLHSQKFSSEKIFSIKFLQEFFRNEGPNPGFPGEKQNENYYNKNNFANKSANLIYDNVYINKNKLKSMGKINLNFGSGVSSTADLTSKEGGNIINNFSKAISTKIILIREKLYFLNKTGQNLTLTQDKCFDAAHYVIYPGGYTTFKWLNNDFPQLLKAKLSDSHFSKPFKIDTIGEFYVNVKSNSSTIVKNSILKVFITEKQGRIIVSFEDATQSPPVCFVNKTNKVFKFEEINKNFFSFLDSNAFSKQNQKNDVVIYPFSSIPFSMEDLIVNNIVVKVNNIGLEYQSSEEDFTEYDDFNIIEIEERKKVFQNFLIFKDRSQNLFLGLEAQKDFGAKAHLNPLNGLNSSNKNQGGNNKNFIQYLDLFSKHENYFLFKIYKNESMNHVIEISEINVNEKSKIEEFVFYKTNKLQKAKKAKATEMPKSPASGLSSKITGKLSANANTVGYSPFNFNTGFVINNSINLNANANANNYNINKDDNLNGFSKVNSDANLNLTQVILDNSNANLIGREDEILRGNANNNNNKNSNLILQKIAGFNGNSETRNLEDLNKNLNDDLETESNKHSYAYSNKNSKNKNASNHSQTQSLNSNIPENKLYSGENNSFLLNKESKNKMVNDNNNNHKNKNQNNLNNENFNYNSELESNKALAGLSPNTNLKKRLSAANELNSELNSGSSNSPSGNNEDIEEFDDLIQYISEFNFNNKTKKNKFYLKISFIGISILDQEPRELAYVFLKNLNLDFSNSNKNIYKLSITLSNLQIDNSIENTLYPVLLKTNKRTGKKEEKENFLTFKTEYNYNKNGNVMYIDNVEVNVKNKILFFADGISFIEFANYAKSLGKILNNSETKAINEANSINKKNFEMNDGFEKRNLNEMRIGQSNFDYGNNEININNGNSSNYNRLDVNYIDDLELDMLDNYFVKVRNLNFISSNESKDDVENFAIKSVNANDKKLKILMNNIYVSQISFEVTIKPTQNLIHKFSNPLRFLLMLIRTENFSQKLDEFNSKGIKSLESKMSTLKNQLRKKKYFIMINLLFSLDILIFSNLIRHFKYGLNSFVNSFKLRQRESVLKLPLNVAIGFLRFNRYLFLGIATSATSFLRSFDELSRYYLGFNKRYGIDKYYNEEDYANKFCVFNALTEHSQMEEFKTTNQYYMHKKHLEYDSSQIMRYYCYKRYMDEVEKGDSLKTYLKNVVCFPIKLSLGITYYSFRAVHNIVDIFKRILRKEDADKFKKIRPLRYINKNVGKLEEYSNIKAIANEKLTQNKKSLNISEDIEKCINISSYESIIFTNLRFVYICLKDPNSVTNLDKESEKNLEDNKNTSSLLSPPLSNKALITATNPNLKNMDLNTLNKISEINSVNLDSIYYVFLEKNSDVNYRYIPNSINESKNNINTLKIYYYDESKINSANKFFNKEYVQKKNLDLNLISPYLHFKRMNNLLIKKIEIKIPNSRMAFRNLETIVKEFNGKIKSKYSFDFGIPKVSVFQNDRMLI